MDAPTYEKTTIKVMHGYSWPLFLLTSCMKSYSHQPTAVQRKRINLYFYLQHDDIFVKHLHSALHIVIIINLKDKHVRFTAISERSSNRLAHSSRTDGITHLVDQREAIPPPHPSMHLGAEHQAAKGEFDQEGGAEFSLTARCTSSYKETFG